MTSRETAVLILTGPPGVGKTTTAGILAARSRRAVHLEADVFFRFICTGYVEPWKPESHEQNRAVMRIVGEAAVGYAAAGYFTIVDGIVFPDWFLEPLRDALHGAGQRVAYAVLRESPSLCAARAQGREREPLADPEVADRLWRAFEDLGELEQNVIDLGGATPEQAADLVAQSLAAGRLAV